MNGQRPVLILNNPWVFVHQLQSLQWRVPTTKTLIEDNVLEKHQYVHISCTWGSVVLALLETLYEVGKATPAHHIKLKCWSRRACVLVDTG